VIAFIDDEIVTSPDATELFQFLEQLDNQRTITAEGHETPSSPESEGANLARQALSELLHFMEELVHDPDQGRGTLSSPGSQGANMARVSLTGRQG
jgi:hypothetical protein